ncbi:zinc finger CCCH domain-containing protein 3 isoform X2 [Anopheles gambiae]|uniref:zinc finger CCCH domain-containing protein 3 isoform X2 n=1 Tax=Anopheles gambiae TaxID=7165 RepID=UPI002AC9750D|nr:zinc finger CCCH domain-containing protein 3 isoform X2 [Anopheles gambiae]
MKPQPEAMDEQPSKIFINPKFAKAHINPMFLASNGSFRQPEVQQVVPASHQSKIHLNPAFLNKLGIQQVMPPTTTAAAPAAPALPAVPTVPQPQPPASHLFAPCKPAFTGTVNPIIKNTRRKLVRATTAVSLPSDASTATAMVKSVAKEMLPSSNLHPPKILAPLVRIGKNKLVRSAVPTTARPEIVKPRVPMNALPERKSLRIDRRLPAVRKSLSQKPTFVKRYALSRIDGITPKKVVVTDPKLLKLKRNPTAVKVHEKSATGKMGTIAYASKNKQLVLVNINGVLYRSSTNKLQKSISRSGTAPSSSSPIIGRSPAKPARKTKEHFLIIRGVRFALDRTGMKLRSVGGTTPPTAITGSRGYAEPRLNRIDIGGLTYKARKDGTFIRTDSHRTRNHLSVAKQRSIQVLASKLKKCNEPCHIYRRLGKCLAHQRGKCPKVHDPKHVSICQRFLRGECLLDGCLLSHDITSLEKMPVCRFFLEGRCVRDPCPYLHKKVSESVRICDAFLNGFCSLADKCPNRHVFQCPTFEQEGKCDRARCPYPHGKKESRRKQDKPSTLVVAHKSEPKEPATMSHVRYYKDEGQSLTVETEHNRSETGELMSASERNQLKRILGEVDKMKQRYRENDDRSVATENRPAEGNEQIVSMPETAPTLAGGDRSDACYSPSEPTPDDPMSDSDGVEEVGEEDTRPPALRRKALGPLPAFIPI